MQIVRGSEIERHIEALGRFRIEIFREYPYLYEGDMDYETKYLSCYLRNPESILVLLSDDKGIVGACTGMPLHDEDLEIREPFRGEDLERIFYIGEVMVRDGSRGRGHGTGLLTKALDAIDAGRYERVSLYTVDRGTDHPLKPCTYCSPDSLWRRLGFEKDGKRLAHYPWRDLGEESETLKPMNVWIKSN